MSVFSNSAFSDADVPSAEASRSRIRKSTPVPIELALLLAIMLAGMVASYFSGVDLTTWAP